ncbi:MAG: putative toxin-antitoxin system toxin component, PIN family [Paludibacteraceae bacterium]|nr:putative toxin-antitoxin system toxin component, PIN family [Paludibacteraceae bacterium]
MICAVIDTNVIVSSLISKNPESPTVKVVEMVFEGNVKPLYNDEIIAEYEEVLKRPKFKFEHFKIDAIITYIKDFGISTSRTSFEGSLPDESDRVFYEISLTEEDSFLVTGNLKHYPVRPQIVTPSQFIEIVKNK